MSCLHLHIECYFAETRQTINKLQHKLDNISALTRDETRRRQWFIRRKQFWGSVNFLGPRNTLENWSNADIIDKWYCVLLLMNATNPMCPISSEKHCFHCPALHCAFDGYSSVALSPSSVHSILKRPITSWFNIRQNPRLGLHSGCLDSRSISIMIMVGCRVVPIPTHPPPPPLLQISTHCRFAKCSF